MRPLRRVPYDWSIRIGSGSAFKLQVPPVVAFELQSNMMCLVVGCDGFMMRWVLCGRGGGREYVWDVLSSLPMFRSYESFSLSLFFFARRRCVSYPDMHVVQVLFRISSYIKEHDENEDKRMKEEKCVIKALLELRSKCTVCSFDEYFFLGIYKRSAMSFCRQRVRRNLRRATGS